MKAEELMIGDWVRCTTDNTIVQIEELFIDEIYGWCYKYGGKFNVLKDVEPISLTPEILEKNGFKEDFERKGIYWRPDCRKFCIVKELDTWYFAFRVLGETVDKSAGYICISECNYVHKLQHLLKDLEIEKEIVL